MKKAIIAVLAGAFAIAACTKPAPAPELTYAGATEITVGQDGDIYTFNFTSNVAWEAALDCSGDVATFSGATSGEAGEGKVKVSVMPFNEKDIRSFTLTISAEGVQSVVVTFTQTGLPFIKALEADADGRIYMTAQETQKSVTIVADKAYTVEFDNKEVEGATLTNEGDVYTFTIPGKSYGEVYTKATFATPTDTVVVRCMKAGLLEEVGVVDIPASLMEGAGRFSLAITGGNIIICNTAKMEVYDMNFTKVKDLAFPTGVTFTGITADDAGNVVASAGKTSENVVLYRLSGSNIDGNWESFLTYAEAKGAYGLDALDARGDVFGNGIVTMFHGGATAYGGINYAISCQITGGTAGNVTEHSLSLLSDKNLWSSDRCYFYPLGTTEAEGYLYNGYDGTDYKIRFIANDDTLTDYLDINTNSSYGNNSMDIVEWNGIKVAATIEMAYFAQWNSSRVILINVSDSTPKILTEYIIEGPLTEGTLQTTDVQLIPADDAVTCIFIDGMQRKIGAIKLAKL